MKKELKEQSDRAVTNEQKLDYIGKLMFIAYLNGFKAGKVVIQNEKAS
ncbi:MAG: hypothetical protein LKJ25_03235 [Clostridia bacterium]|jgi:hypothetical protein|nr:hypothetical protein [Clostridia bacterium]